MKQFNKQRELDQIKEKQAMLDNHEREAKQQLLQAKMSVTNLNKRQFDDIQHRNQQYVIPYIDYNINRKNLRKRWVRYTTCQLLISKEDMKSFRDRRKNQRLER